MRYDKASTRKCVNQLFQTHDLRISMFRQFAKAVGVTLADIIVE